MIAGVERQGQDLLCIIRWVGRRGLAVKALTYCNGEANAAEGVVQLPDSTLHKSYVSSADGRRMLLVCATCKHGATR